MAISKRRQDYAKKKDRQARAKKSRAKSAVFSHIRFALITAALIAGFLYLLLHLKNPSQPMPIQGDVPLVKNNTGALAAVDKPHRKSSSHSAPQAQFEFYTLLSDNTGTQAPTAKPVDENQGARAEQHALPAVVEAETTSETQSPFDALSTASAPAQSLPTASASPQQVKAEEPVEYVLQVASFKKEEDAKTTRAKLLMLGFDPKIQQHKDSYRVVLGPYTDKAKMRTQREALVNQGMPGFLRKVEREPKAA